MQIVIIEIHLNQWFYLCPPMHLNVIDNLIEVEFFISVF